MQEHTSTSLRPESVNGHFLVIVVLKPFRSIRAIAALWKVGKFVTVVLGGLDVAWVSPRWSDQGDTPVNLAWFAPHGLAAVGCGLEVGLFPGGRRPPGSDNRGRWGMGMTLGEDK